MPDHEVVDAINEKQTLANENFRPPGAILVAVGDGHGDDFDGASLPHHVLACHHEASPPTVVGLWFSRIRHRRASLHIFAGFEPTHASECLISIIHTAFLRFDLHRIDSCVASDELVAEALTLARFIREASFEGALFIEGARRDMVVYAMLNPKDLAN